ncbi:MAG TPA: ankyrin repeat domain-containing protein, partial [Patescibacteria group bacterium]|nr:ankyrin repeat domain-containing protein [Patescibacteria group bacterium]
LHHAQEQSSFQAFVQLVGMGADRHEDYGNGWNPLIMAFARRHSTFIDYLLDGDQKTLNSVATDGPHSFTALHLAVDLGDEDHIVKMIQRGADTTIKATPGRDAVTAGEYARARHKPRIAEIFDLAPTIRAQFEQDAAEMRALMAVPPPDPKQEPPVQSPFRGVAAAA